MWAMKYFAGGIEVLLRGGRLCVVGHGWNAGRFGQSVIPDVAIGRSTRHFPGVDAINSRFARQLVIVVLRVEMRRDAPLFEVVDAGDALSRHFAAHDAAKNQPREDYPGRYHDEQFQERERRKVQSSRSGSPWVLKVYLPVRFHRTVILRTICCAFPKSFCRYTPRSRSGCLERHQEF